MSGRASQKSSPSVRPECLLKANKYYLSLFFSHVAKMADSRIRQIPWGKEMATHCSILAWRMPWSEETGRLQFMGS